VFGTVGVLGVAFVVGSAAAMSEKSKYGCRDDRNEVGPDLIADASMDKFGPSDEIKGS
jgi:hypothetical protein